jgi:YegS/Rv2252/BmrU family lipid kinase
VSNPASAMGRSKSALEQTVAWLQQHGVATHQLVSQHAGHLLEALPPLLKDDWQGLAVLGGDGTLFEVINICLEMNGGVFTTPLAVIPGGTGNSFSKDLSGDKRENFLQKMINGAPQPVDVAHCRFAPKNNAGRKWHKNEFYFINVLGAGFVAEVNHRSFAFKNLGILGYAVSVVAALKKMRYYQMRLVIDDLVIEKPNTFVAICNSRVVGGNMLIAPNASIRDGWLDVVVTDAISRAELLMTFPKVFSGAHMSHPAVNIFRGKRLHLETDPPSLLTPDGETLGTTPIDVEILPGKLRFMT